MGKKAQLPLSLYAQIRSLFFFLSLFSYLIFNLSFIFFLPHQKKKQLIVNLNSPYSKFYLINEISDIFY